MQNYGRKKRQKNGISEQPVSKHDWRQQLKQENGVILPRTAGVHTQCFDEMKLSFRLKESHDSPDPDLAAVDPDPAGRAHSQASWAVLMSPSLHGSRRRISSCHPTEALRLKT